MAIKWIVSGGYGFSPGSVGLIVTAGYDIGVSPLVNACIATDGYGAHPRIAIRGFGSYVPAAVSPPRRASFTAWTDKDATYSTWTNKDATYSEDDI